jgi:hypothetical protein
MSPCRWANRQQECRGRIGTDMPCMRRARSITHIKWSKSDCDFGVVMSNRSQYGLCLSAIAQLSATSLVNASAGWCSNQLVVVGGSP